MHKNLACMYACTIRFSRVTSFTYRMSLSISLFATVLVSSIISLKFEPIQTGRPPSHWFSRRPYMTENDGWRNWASLAESQETWSVLQRPIRSGRATGMMQAYFLFALMTTPMTLNGLPTIAAICMHEPEGPSSYHIPFIFSCVDYDEMGQISFFTHPVSVANRAGISVACKNSLWLRRGHDCPKRIVHLSLWHAVSGVSRYFSGYRITWMVHKTSISGYLPGRTEKDAKRTLPHLISEAEDWTSRNSN